MGSKKQVLVEQYFVVVGVASVWTSLYFDCRNRQLAELRVE